MDITIPYAIGCIFSCLCTLELYFKVCEKTIWGALNPVLIAAFLLNTAYSWIGILIALGTAVIWHRVNKQHSFAVPKATTTGKKDS